MSVKTFILLSLVLVVGGALFGAISGQSRLIEIELAASLSSDEGLRSQSPAVRAWRPRPSTRVLTVEPAASGLVGPLRLEVDAKGRLYIVDYETLTLLVTDERGQKLWELGGANGRAFESLTDIDFGPAGEIWLADNSARRVVRVSESGEYLSDHEVPGWPYRIVTGRRSVVLMDPTETPMLFRRLSFRGETLGTFGQFLERQERAPLALDGWIERDEHDGFVYAGLYSGLLAGFTFSGQRRFVVETIDGLRFPALHRGAKGVVQVSQDSRKSAYSLSVVDNRVYLLSSERRGLQEIGAVDSYDLEDGSYRGSFRLPEPCREVVVTASHLYTVKENTIGKWRFDDAS